MQDPPSPPEILGAVARFLRSMATAEAGGAAAFQARVAANALEMMRRQLELSPGEDLAEAERLKALLGADGDLLSLNTELARRIEAGEMDLATPGLADHLWATTLAKLAVDQPTYGGYLAALAERGQGESPMETTPNSAPLAKPLTPPSSKPGVTILSGSGRGFVIGGQGHSPAPKGPAKET
jgi:hypothetical protein